ncbi:class I lanthipeptide [Lewinella sp. W8]|uniref:class I lanthipeptide n=1 Tax=Lewinella sp. W8 TaxID=2528208 RepID=UPI0010689967|nr:class I lanthipeptide [Lewinella sp. W8]MTB50739.1 hypothetical protein [Lewinella sp. W8]
MANNNNLNLDKERLVRLQEEQLSAAAGGEGPGSTTIVIEPTIGLAALDGDTAQKNGGSCCKKSCTEEPA